MRHESGARARAPKSPRTPPPPKKKRTFSKTLPLLGAVLLCACSSKQFYRPQGEVDVIVKHPDPAYVMQLNRLDSFVRLHSGNYREKQLLERFFSGTQTDALEALPLLEEMFAYGERYSGVKSALKLAETSSQLRDILDFLKSPGFEPWMAESCPRLILYWGGKEGYMCIPESFFSRRGLTHESVSLMQELVDALKSSACSKKQCAFDILDGFAASPDALEFSVYLSRAFSGGSFIEKLGVLRDAVESGKFTPEVMDFIREVALRKGIFHEHDLKDAMSLLFAAFSNPSFKGEHFRPMLASLNFFCNDDEYSHSFFFYTRLFKKLASHPGFEPWMPDEYGAAYRSDKFSGGNRTNCFTHSGKSFKDAFEAYLGNPNTDISSPENVSRTLVSGYFRGMTGRDFCKSGWGSLAEFLGKKEAGKEEVSALNSLALRAGIENALKSLISAFGILIGRGDYSPKQIGAFGEVFDSAKKAGGNPGASSCMSNLEEFLKSAPLGQHPLYKVHCLSVRMGIPVSKATGILKAFFSVPELSRPINFEYFIKKGGELAEKIGANYTNPEVRANFGYAFGAKGEYAAEYLFYEYGIEYSARYAAPVLEELVRGLNPEYKKEYPIALAAVSKHDWNGSLYGETYVSSFVGKYRIMALETASREEFFSGIPTLLEKREMIPGATSRMKVLVLDAHGDEHFIRIGTKGKSGSSITRASVHGFSPLRPYFEDDGIMIIGSCSAGGGYKPIAYDISKELPGIKVYGAMGGVSDIEYKVGNSGKPDKVRLDSPTSVYLNGEEVDSFYLTSPLR